MVSVPEGFPKNVRPLIVVRSHHCAVGFCHESLEWSCAGTHGERTTGVTPDLVASKERDSARGRNW